ncbi:amidohydrolase [Listeria grayi]|uniref:Deaminase n=1 Tax=Listeria grayi DSM 20601 TaxID=525367 RepID=D7UWZ1_LISGR|nr:amidohydrolase [Listeria grayi]EFI84199.1 putative deaminase [Listeria grayi DSM 20601]
MGTTLLKNVRLEVGEEQLDTGIKTKTELFHVMIEAGKITGISPAVEPITAEIAKTIDAKGKLAVPSFKDMHNHLDKTYLSLNWKAAVPVSSLRERLILEAEELSLLAPSTKERAEKMIKSIISRGTTHIRTHVNIDPYIGLKNLEGVAAALAEFDDILTYDIVAFPQHGLLRHDVPQLMREALRSGATMVGGLDPGGIDHAVERSLAQTMDLAVESGKPVDIHLHDNGHLGSYTVESWLQLVEDSQEKITSAFSHAFCLGQIGVGERQEIITRLAAQQMEILSTIPISLGSTLPPIDELTQAGVPVHLGCDGFYDSWRPYVSSDILEKAAHFCELTRKSDERGLRAGLRHITGGITPLDAKGNQIWPKIGDEASFVLADVASSAELTARRPQKRQLIARGKEVEWER